MNKILIVLLLVAVVAVGGYFAWQYWPESQPVVVDQNTNDETANWQAYTNGEYGFEIKYPKEWYEKNFTEEPSIITLQNVDCFFCIYAGGPCGECYPEAGVKVIISMESNPQNLSLDKFLNQCNDETTFQCDNISIDGVNAMKVTRLIDIGAGLPVVYIPKGNNIFMIAYGDMVSDKDLKDSYLSVFDKILFTFKFLPQD